MCILSTPFCSSWKNETGKDRDIALKFGDVEPTKDYAERMNFESDNEIMSEQFGNYCSLSIEGNIARFLPDTNNMKVNKKIRNTISLLII